MIRLHIVVEGSTEESFVKTSLVDHLAAHNVSASATIVGKAVSKGRGRHERGGGSFKSWRKDIETILRGDSRANLRVTTLFDLYGLPRDFPGLSQFGNDADTNRRCDALQAELGAAIPDPRFIPYLQRHEFEALVLCGLSKLRYLTDAEEQVVGIEKLEAQISGMSPEDVNDGKHTAPSKRLEACVPGYSKSLHGPLVVEDVGLQTLRTRCPRFGRWVEQLENL